MATGVTRPIAEGISRVLDSAYGKLGETAFGKQAIDLLWSMEQTFRTDPRLGPVFDMAMHGIKTRESIKPQLYAPLEALQKGIKEDKSLSLMMNYRKANLQQVHATLPPGPVKQSAMTLMQTNPVHATRTMEEIEGDLASEANTIGRTAAVGPNSINLAATLYPMLKGSPTDKTKAQAALSVLSMIFKDNKPVWNKPGIEESRIKNDVNKYMKHTLKTYYGKSAAAAYKMDLSAEFKQSTEVERAIHKYGVKWLAPAIFVAHLADFAKLPATVPAKALWDTLTAQSPANLQQLKTASGIFFHTMHSILHNDFLYRTGQISKMTKLPEVGAIVNKFTHNPLFLNVRQLQLSIFGSAGYHSAQYWAHQALRGDAGAISALKEIGLDPQGIISRGGKLEVPELETAIFHFVNNRLFIDKPLQRSFYSGSSPFFRVANMFHGYITREGRLLTHELMRMGKANDYVGIAQFAGTVFALFPYTAGPLIESLGILVRTGSLTQAGTDLKEDEAALWGKRGFKSWLGTYLTLLGHFGGAGAFMNYVHAATNHRLAAAFLGPVPQVATEIGEDIATPIFKPSKTTGKGDWRPLERDVLRYMTIPLFGNWAAQHLIPKGRTTPSTRSRLRLRRR